ncbi:MAG TPA: prolipoprotein diacylglyceryl transferase [Gaiellales bacterium]
MLLSLPSPGDPYVFKLGSFQPRWYGLILVIAIAAGVWMARRGFARRGLDPERVVPIAVAAVLLGFVGARIEHVVTDWEPFAAIPRNTFIIWRGGLGIYGGIIGGMIGAAIACRLMRLPFWVVADCAAPAIVLGQAIGRFANYANQELYGHPSSLPWAIRIDNPVPPYLPGRAFQPTFLYEALWDLAVFAILLWFARRVGGRIRPGTVFALYAALYAAGRLVMERIRIDHTTYVLGQRVEIWVSLVVLVLAASAFAVLWRRRVTI